MQIHSESNVARKPETSRANTNPHQDTFKRIEGDEEVAIQYKCERREETLRDNDEESEDSGGWKTNREQLATQDNGKRPKREQ